MWGELKVVLVKKKSAPTEAPIPDGGKIRD
jgi:hypothetical protein